MILSDKKIIAEMKRGNIVIKPFDIKNMGGNSYDVHLSKYFSQYVDKTLDAKKHNKVKHFEIPEIGFVLKPGQLYLCTTVEYTETHKHVPFLEGKSSTGRLGIDIHATAGKGDVGYCGYWTMEISTSKPVRIYPGMQIAQLIYYAVDGKVERIYTKKKNSKYFNEDQLPREYMGWKNFDKKNF
ncbi:MAG: Deoxycytidine triphosphate deaminase [Candidatus Nomurabacteria bacterium GW2011_GWA1_37_20]|uniref:Deoxycytidine triphosphate deaminase n=1 Tax=Candidatus Nomurabacteria bacterium GW2011_GWA1_37_20 TaxID=1618729 RepID=A0A0G0JVR0_9BACT|nr:MAG: Deoxycytidine triphosphate deaminase [Parcubacteria group bacterium GW2011_GWC1_36_9]KKQ26761.1 MAG: Deoxycytidine triphosphate deaminase [Parcubacteria group bacterium GW2011_GWB1_37_13]KKQ32411.1 MAG: Deoxycytidine triphosphate deaminase [Candidatus Nomurabacteria bacterium GW2011_GWA1_37_20]